jgi:hypothetical protein
MTYGVGRGVGASDEPFIRAIMRDTAPSGYSFESLIVGIVNSVPFSMRRPSVVGATVAAAP